MHLSTLENSSTFARYICLKDESTNISLDISRYTQRIKYTWNDNQDYYNSLVTTQYTYSLIVWKESVNDGARDKVLFQQYHILLYVTFRLYNISKERRLDLNKI